MYNIIFDFDGTLFRTETVDISAINMSLEKFGGTALSEGEILSYLGMPLDKIAEKCLKINDKELIKKFRKQVIENELKLIPRFSRTYPFAITLLNRLKQKGHKLAICSNGSKQYILKLVEHFELNQYLKRLDIKDMGFRKVAVR